MKGEQRFGIKRVDPRDRKNVLSVQGAPKKALPSRDALYQWFVDIKGAVKTRISHKYVLANARRLLSEYVKSFLEAGMPIPQGSPAHGCLALAMEGRARDLLQEA